MTRFDSSLFSSRKPFQHNDEQGVGRPQRMRSSQRRHRWGSATALMLAMLVLGPLACGKRTEKTADESGRKSGAKTEAAREAVQTRDSRSSARAAQARIQARPTQARTSPGKAEGSAKGQARPAGNGSASAAGLSMAPLKTQLKRRAVRMKFLGWTKDGHAFVLQAWRGRSGSSGDGGQYVLREVRDALTGNMVASFRVRSELEKGVQRSGWDEAKPKAEWAQFLAAHPLVATEPSRKAPAGLSRIQGAKLTFNRIGKALFGSKCSIKPNRKGAKFVWGGFKEANKPSDGDKARKARSPRIRINLVLPGAKNPDMLLTFRLSATYADMMDALDMYGDDRDTRAVGSIRAYWSPVGDRMVLLISSDLIDGNSEVPHDQARFYVRTLGPQYRMFAQKSQEAAVRVLAWRLAASGLAPSDILFDAKPIAQTEIEYRGEDGKRLADALVAAISGSKIAGTLAGRGWLRAKVHLHLP